METLNDRGWALLQKPDRTRDDLEEAVRCFEQAIGGGSVLAVANLGDALLAQDRTADALADLDKLSRGDHELAARAHNWLGWYFLTKQLDLSRSIAHLEAATRLVPGWGIPWLHLAKALDATGDLQRAAVAYGTAIEHGDSHDDKFARDRRLQLEMQLLLRGEPPPPPPASAIADSRAFEIVRETAARLPSPLAFMIRPTQRAGGRVMPAIIGVVVQTRAPGEASVPGDRAPGESPVPGESRALGACIVDPTPSATAHVLQRDRDGLSFADSANLLPWLDGLDPAALTPIDVAMWIFDKLAEPDWSWAITQAKPATITLWPRNITVAAREGGGVAIRVGRATFEVSEIAATLALEGALRTAITAEKERLHTWDLREGARYRVLEPFGALVGGELATLVQLQIYGRSEYAVYVFEGEAGGRATLEDYRDDAILGDIDRYLARHA